MTLQAEGNISGCNVGTLLNWGGTMDVTVDAVVAAATPVPAISPPLVALLCAMLVLAAGLMMRKRRER